MGKRRVNMRKNKAVINRDKTRKGLVMKEKAVLVDIDGTLVNVTPNWSADRDAEWVEETMNAVGYKFAVAMVKKYKKMGYKIVIVTARGRSCKENTVKKLKEIGVYEFVDVMMHRTKAYENTRSAVWKKAAIRMLKQRYDFVFAMEDEEGNMEVMRKNGMIVIDAKIWWKK
jgi:phosphoglycolate phosphatase-like HAD superfamily hydrolase